MKERGARPSFFSEKINKRDVCMKFNELSAEERAALLSQYTAEYEAYRARGLRLDLSRGKPAAEQLDLSNGLFQALSAEDCRATGADYRNYGLGEGIPAMRHLFSELYGVPEELILACGNSSLQLMHDTLMRCMVFGVGDGHTPWCREERIKWLCVTPGYDRHFAITERLGFELISVPMTEDGPDMDMVEELVKDSAVKGMWCVPKYSNPTGNTYSEETVRRLVSMPCAAPDFRIFWDNAYAIHDLELDGDVLADVFALAEEVGNEDRIYYFASTSKITFPGAGVAMMAASKHNLAHLKPLMNLQTIGYDKINQCRHVAFLKDGATTMAHMHALADSLRPKFACTLRHLSELRALGIASYTEPKGGYFVSLDVLPGTARRVFFLMKEAGVTLTQVGATFPYGVDPKDTNLRLAPTYATLEELELGMSILVLAVKIAALESMV